MCRTDCWTTEYLVKILRDTILFIGKDKCPGFTDNASNCVSSKLLMECFPKRFCTSYAMHCLDLVLHDIRKRVWVLGNITQARKLAQLTLSFLRKY